MDDLATEPATAPDCECKLPVWRCTARASDRSSDGGGYYCTRPAGHAGEHVACGRDEHRLYTWGNDRLVREPSPGLLVYPDGCPTFSIGRIEEAFKAAFAEWRREHDFGDVPNPFEGRVLDSIKERLLASAKP